MSIFSLIFVLFPLALATESPWSSEAQNIIKKELQGIGGRPENFGIWVKQGSQVAHHNGDRQFIPASLSKIPTALTFLSQRSMDHKFKTWIYHTGRIHKGVLEGDLYLKGGGDPSLVTESLWIMVNKLRRSDFRKIEGKVFVDESYFDLHYYSQGRETKRVDRAYDAPISGLSLNWNTVSVYIRPGQKWGSQARIYTDPELSMIEIQNKTRTIGHGTTDLRVDRQFKKGKILIQVTGSILISEKEKAFYKSIGDGALWTGHSFIKLLNQAGIQSPQEVEKKTTPSGAKLLVEQDSWTLREIMAALSKFSNNFVAEMLTKQLGKKAQVPGSMDQGLKKIKQFLLQKNWPQEQFSFVSPSGFSRKNKMRADLLGELLDQARGDFQSYPEFMASLPISGVDGTLKSRMKQSMRGKVRAKTGYLSGVVGLAGYMENPQGDSPLTFVFLYNGPSKKDWEVRAMFNRLLWRLYQKS